MRASKYSFKHTSFTVNEITVPSVTIRPAVNDYFEGDRIQLECIADGNPAPRLTWQRASNRPLPLSSESFDELFIIESAREEDSGEYRSDITRIYKKTHGLRILTLYIN